MNEKSALIIGASGLVGGHCLEMLLQQEIYGKVIALVRHPLERVHPKLIQHVIDFEKLEQYQEQIKGDDIYCCIGTTIQKSPNQKEYFKIDYHYPYEIGKIALANGAEQYSLISAISANSKAIFFYSRVKGQLEEAICQLNFKSVYILRPSYLIGKRKEFRSIEKLGAFVLKVLSPLLQGPLKKYRAIEAKMVAKAMVQLSMQHTPGIHIYSGDEIVKAAC